MDRHFFYKLDKQRGLPVGVRETQNYKSMVDKLMADAISSLKREDYAFIFNSCIICVGDRNTVGPLLDSLGEERHKVIAYFFVGSTIDQTIFTHFSHYSEELYSFYFPHLKNDVLQRNDNSRPATILGYGKNWTTINEVADIIFKDFIEWFPKEELDDFENALFRDKDVDRRLAEVFSKAKEVLVH